MIVEIGRCVVERAWSDLVPRQLVDELEIIAAGLPVLLLVVGLLGLLEHRQCVELLDLVAPRAERIVRAGGGQRLLAPLFGGREIAEAEMPLRHQIVRLRGQRVAAVLADQAVERGDGGRELLGIEVELAFLEQQRRILVATGIERDVVFVGPHQSVDHRRRQRWLLGLGEFLDDQDA